MPVTTMCRGCLVTVSVLLVNFYVVVFSDAQKTAPCYLDSHYDNGSSLLDAIREGREIMIEGFNWESWKYSWWQVLHDNMYRIAGAGFTAIWLPPPYNSYSSQGYLPQNYYSLDTAYGNETELRSLLGLIKSYNIRAIGDIVINHRTGTTKGYGGIYNRYDGIPMPWDEYAVTNDTGGLGHPNTGAIFGGTPNIDHIQPFVRADLSEWLRWMLSNVSFTSFRFDFARGYAPVFAVDYITASHPDFCVGEFWDSMNYTGPPNYTLEYNQDSHRQRQIDWVKGTRGLCTVFDFTTKGILQQAVGNQEWWRLKDANGQPPGVVGWWPSRAVTFVENHDTGSTQNLWPFPSQYILLGYAYILTHPGMPCIFWDHFFDWGVDTRNAITELIAIRKLQQLHSRSQVTILAANSSVYAAMIQGNLTMKLGQGDWSPGSGWNLATSGDQYAVWLRQM